MNSLLRERLSRSSFACIASWNGPFTHACIVNCPYTPAARR
jgi:hypothetical protein